MENKQLNLSEPENIMGTMDVNPLLIKLSIPMMISMLVQALYNVVDSIFVARVSENALTAVSLAFSLQNMMFAVGIGTGVGVNALLSKSLGEKNQSRANKTAENGLFLALCSYLVFLVLGLTVVRPYFYAQTADADIAEQGIRYLTICCVLSLGMFMQVMNEKLLAATSRTTLSMISQLVGAIVNIILDPIFIFGYCGEALSGTTGAALATVIGQFCGAGVSFYLNLRKNPDIQLDFKGFRPSAEAIKRIYVVGLPSIAMQCVGSVMTFLMNQILMAFTATAVAVFGVYFKLQSFVFMPIFGMNNGMVPIIGYNYGARKPDRVKKTINPHLEIEGVLLTMLDGRTNLGLQVVDEVKKHFKKQVYATVIPRSVRLGEAPSHGEPIHVYDKRSAGCVAYVNLAKEVLKRNNIKVKEFKL